MQLKVTTLKIGEPQMLEKATEYSFLVITSSDFMVILFPSNNTQNAFNISKKAISTQDLGYIWNYNE